MNKYIDINFSKIDDTECLSIENSYLCDRGGK